VNPGPTENLDLAGLLDRLGFADDERVSICSKPIGGSFTAELTTVSSVGDLPQDRDVWFGINPIRADVKGRGEVEDVTRFSTLCADLDVKPRGCPDLTTAHLIIDDLSGMLHTRPVAVTFSGHGLQPLWAVEDAPLTTPAERRRATALLQRWGRLVRRVAQARHSEVDSVFDLPRILRAPGTVNYKADPVATSTEGDNGRPLRLDEIEIVLDEYGVMAMPDDSDEIGGPDLPHAAWDALDDSLRGRVDRYLRVVVRGEANDLTEAAGWLEGHRDERDRGWQKVLADVCYRFGSLARADWTPWDLAEARKALGEIVPTEIATTVGLDLTWRQQRGRSDPARWPETLNQPQSGDFSDIHGDKGPTITSTTGEPIEPQETGPAGATVTGEDRPPVLTKGAWATIPTGERLAEKALRDRFIYVPGIGWHEWDGQRWKGAGEVTRLHVRNVASTWAVEQIQAMVVNPTPTTPPSARRSPTASLAQSRRSSESPSRPPAYSSPPTSSTGNRTCCAASTGSST
jgi:hypothetical protein